MPKRDTKLFEVLIGQIAKDGGVDIALDKALRVRTAERFQPVRNLRHHGPVACASGSAVCGVILSFARLKGATWRTRMALSRSLAVFAPRRRHG